jgi:hypothetical protein
MLILPLNKKCGFDHCSLPFLISTARTWKKPKWLADFFAVTIANCFDEIEDNVIDPSVCSIFEHHFGQWVSYKQL